MDDDEDHSTINDLRVELIQLKRDGLITDIVYWLILSRIDYYDFKQKAGYKVYLPLKATDLIFKYS